jgi:flagellar biogenesis protein FliO
MDPMQNGLAVLLTLSLLGGVLWWLRRRGMARFTGRFPSGTKTRRMKALERLALSPQHSLHLVEVEGRTVLIAASPGGCSILDTLSGSPEKAEAR